MATRLYFLVPNVEICQRIVDELLVDRIDQRHIHVIAREGMALEDLPQARLVDRTDVVRALERGAAAGGATGLLAGLLAIAFPPAGLVLGGGAVLATALAGAGFGAWAASLIGASLPNSELESFEQAIQSGQLLMLVDVPSGRARIVADLIRLHHPEVDIANVEIEKQF